MLHLEVKGDDYLDIPKINKNKRVQEVNNTFNYFYLALYRTTIFVCRLVTQIKFATNSEFSFALKNLKN